MTARAAGSIVAEDTDPSLAAVRAAAAEGGIHVQLGSLALAGGAGGRFINRAFLIGPDGTILSRYDKMHLFDVDLADGTSWRESAAYAPGDHAVLADTPWGKLGLTICYDVRFPDLYQSLSDAGAALLAIPAAFTVPTGAAHWHILLRARAIESQAFVIAAAQTGTHQDGRKTYGHSLVVDPWGAVLLDMDDTPGLAVVDLDLARIVEVRTRIPALSHRRPVKLA